METIKNFLGDAGRKHLLAIVGVLMIALNKSLGLGLSHEDVYGMAAILGFYFIGEGASDLGEKLGIHVKDAIAKIIALKLGVSAPAPDPKSSPGASGDGAGGGVHP